MYVYMYVCMYICIYVCMYVRICVCVRTNEVEGRFIMTLTYNPDRPYNDTEVNEHGHEAEDKHCNH